jgi:hypothetical protein
MTITCGSPCDILISEPAGPGKMSAPRGLAWAAGADEVIE